VIDGYCKDFQKESGIEVTPVYAGNYGETLTKAVTAIKAGQGPQMAILLAAEMHSLQDMDILASLDDMGLDADGKKWVDGFFPAFMANSHVEGKLWSVPFQRSTAIIYYNKAAFGEAGLNPDAFPKTWAELADAATKLTKRDASGRVTRWGIKVAGDLGNAQWTYGAYAFQAGHKLMNEAGTEVYFNDPKAIEALTYWHDLSAKYKATPEGVSEWGTLPPDFFQGNAAIIQHHHRQSDQHAQFGEISLGRGRTAGQGRPAHGGGRRQHVFLQAGKPGRARRGAAVREVPDHA